MKKLKTWEMIKELTENPKKKFKNDITHIVGLNNKGELCWMKTAENEELAMTLGIGPNWDNLNIEWEEVKQPVTWQEAIEAYSQGASAYYLLDDNAKHYITQKLVIRAAIIRGKWYIEGR